MPPSKLFATTAVPSSGAARTSPAFMRWEWARPGVLTTCYIRRRSAWTKNGTGRLSEKCMKGVFPIWIVRTCLFRKFGAWKVFACGRLTACFQNSMVCHGPNAIIKPLPGKMPALSTAPFLPQTMCCIASARGPSSPWAIPRGWALSIPGKCYPSCIIVS